MLTSWRFSLLICLLAIAGCANPVQQFAAMRDANRQALNKIEVNMSRSQVFEIMGNRSAEHFVQGRFENPYRRDLIRIPDGRSCEVLYCYTQKIDDQPIDSGLTPIVLIDGKVSGVGWAYLDSITGSATTIRRR